MKELLDKYDTCSLECDGLTRVLTTVLQWEGIEHSCMVGSITYSVCEEQMTPHFWIELPDGTIIDYRARMWLGDSPDIPHGVFNLKDYPSITDEGTPLTLPPLPSFLFDVLAAERWT